jgi:hypothetical protein
MGFVIKLNHEEFNDWQKADSKGNVFTLIREGTDSALQFSYRKYVGSKPLEMPPEKLIFLAMNGIERIQHPQAKLSASGECIFGRFGSVIVKGGDPGYFQSWVLWDNKGGLILVTYTADRHDAQEASEAHQIAMATGYKE